MLSVSPGDVKGGGFPHLYPSVLLEPFNIFQILSHYAILFRYSTQSCINATTVLLQFFSIYWYRQKLALHLASGHLHCLENSV